MKMEPEPLFLTAELIQEYCRIKQSQGVSHITISRNRSYLNLLDTWLGENKLLTPERLGQWRKSLEDCGYSKNTIYNYIKAVNGFLRTTGNDAYCIPKPIRCDLTGRTFGYLTVLEPTEKREKRNVIWHCRCKCGKETEVRTELLLSGKSTSCGCLKKEVLQFANRYEEGTALLQVLNDQPLNPNSASGYVGVVPSHGRWQAQTDYKKQRHYLGSYTSIDDAAKARARAKEAVMEDARRIYEETDHLYIQAPARPPKPEKPIAEPEQPRILPARRSDNTSGYPGVTRKKGRWYAKINWQGVQYRFGYFDHLEDAVVIRQLAEAYVSSGDLEKLKALSKNIDFSPLKNKG